MIPKGFKKYTWKEILALPEGTKLHDEVYSSSPPMRFIVLRGVFSLNAYVGIPLEHPLAYHSYKDMDVKVHRDLIFAITFSDEGDGRMLPKDYWWYGWDYAKGGDFSFLDEKSPRGISLKYLDPDALKKHEKYIRAYLENDSRKKWLVEDIIKDSRETLEDFKQLMLLEEQWAKDKKE